jgi:hypothetical protein
MISFQIFFESNWPTNRRIRGEYRLNLACKGDERYVTKMIKFRSF